MSNSTTDYNKTDHENANTKAATIQSNKLSFKKQQIENILARDLAEKGRH